MKIKSLALQDIIEELKTLGEFKVIEGSLGIFWVIYLPLKKPILIDSFREKDLSYKMSLLSDINELKCGG